MISACGYISRVTLAFPSLIKSVYVFFKFSLPSLLNTMFTINSACLSSRVPLLFHKLQYISPPAPVCCIRHSTQAPLNEGHLRRAQDTSEDKSTFNPKSFSKSDLRARFSSVNGSRSEQNPMFPLNTRPVTWIPTDLHGLMAAATPADLHLHSEAPPPANGHKLYIDFVI